MATTILDYPLIRPKNRNDTQRVCIGLGFTFLAIGVFGLFAPAGVISPKLSVAHELIRIVFGLFSISVGLATKPEAANRFSLWMGSFLVVGAFAGFLFGKSGQDPFLVRIIPNVLEFGIISHILHLFSGGALLLSLLPTRAQIKA